MLHTVRLLPHRLTSPAILVEWIPGQPCYHGNMWMVVPLDGITTSQGLEIRTRERGLGPLFSQVVPIVVQWLGIRTPWNGER